MSCAGNHESHDRDPPPLADSRCLQYMATLGLPSPAKRGRTRGGALSSSIVESVGRCRASYCVNSPMASASETDSTCRETETAGTRTTVDRVQRKTSWWWSGTVVAVSIWPGGLWTSRTRVTVDVDVVVVEWVVVLVVAGW